MTTPPPPAAMRTEEIRPPSARRETGMVLKTAFHIAYWSAFVIFAHPPASAAAISDNPFERRFQDLDAADQRVFRALQEGIIEAEADRSRAGQWPSSVALGQRGVPPFAPDPIDKAGYTWRFLSRKTLVNYVGTPAGGSGRRSFVVILTEPDPGTPPDPQTQVDEIHHRLGDGMMIHVSVWIGPGLGDVRDPVAFVNPDDGWQRIVVGQTAVPSK